MKGEIDKIWENETKDRKKIYHVVDINGDRYSVWDKKILEGISEGDYIDYDWKPSGDYKKIVDLKKIDPDPNLDKKYIPDDKSRGIIRMSCLRSATEILNGIPIDLDQKTCMALEISREFENYVLGSEETDD